VVERSGTFGRARARIHGGESGRRNAWEEFVAGCAWGQGDIEEEAEVWEGGGEFAESVECIVQEERTGCAAVAQIFEVG
jgi:hypothetical protein